ncbi:MAG: type II toxin-antitoxin system RatA family toxin [Hyphomicrobiaceae bacterium]
MKTFRTRKFVKHSATEMFDLVADVENYPKFVPLCESLSVRQRYFEADHEILIADMTVSFRLFRESFASRVELQRDNNQILVNYLDGPFRQLDNKWRFTPQSPTGSEVDFFIAYEFRSRSLQLLVGAMFDRAFRRFTDAFEERADAVYGQPRHHHYTTFQRA